jgi:competence protein ComEC
MDRRRLLGVVSATILIFVSVLAWGVVFGEEKQDELTVSFLDVGQGDSIFIESPSGGQLLIDGGPDRSVLRELGKQMKWYDRHIDVVIATHPDTDHVAGLFDVLKRYDVDYIFRPGIKHDAQAAQSLLKEIANEDAEEFLARRGQRIDLGDDVRLEILFPDRDVSDVETNTGSIVARLIYGETSFLFTGDSPQAIEKYLASIDGKNLKSDVLKVGHHGSKTSSATDFLGFVSPKYGVLSRGCDNRYGHPHQEVLDELERFEIEVADTCEDGTITYVSDGQNIHIK